MLKLLKLKKESYMEMHIKNNKRTKAHTIIKQTKVKINVNSKC